MKKRKDLTISIIREEAKNRTAKHLKKQAKLGYKFTSFFASENFRTEIKRLKEEKGLSRQKSMELIFNVYCEKRKNKK